METETLFEGKFIRLLRRGKWEWVQRTNCRAVVTVVPITDDQSFIFVEQHRPPIGKNCIEFPAGLVGDGADKGEPTITSAYRELLEETGYHADYINKKGSMYPSPGLTDERTSVCVATGLKKVHEGGGVGSENITVHKVLASDVWDWIEKQRGLGKGISTNVTSGLSFAWNTIASMSKNK
jgi:ADP-ribose pyrophosphatase